MKKKLSLIFLSILTLLLSSSSTILAKTMSGTDLTIASDEVIDDDLFIAGTNIDIAGTVNGDIYAAGEKINFTGTVNGDLIAAAGVITVSGEIAEDLRIFAKEITVSEANIVGSLTAAAGQVIVADSVSVAQSAMIAGTDNLFAGKTMRHLLIAGTNNRVTGQVARDLMTAGEKINIDPTASVSGNLIYGSDREVNLASRSSVLGEVVRKEMPAKWQQSHEWLRVKENLRWPKTLWHTFKFFSFLLWSILLLALWPKMFKKMAAKIEVQPAKNILIGLIALFLMTPVFVFLLLTIVGIPLAFMFLIWSCMLMSFAKAFVAVWIGQKAFDALQPKPKQKSVIWQFLFGYLIYSVIGLVPGFGWLWSFVVMLLGTGVVYLSIFDRKKKK